MPGLETRWARANNLTVANFSATCFLTGAELQLNRAYPVGLIDSSWAGVSITALSSMASCGRCGLDARAGCPGGNPYVGLGGGWWRWWEVGGGWWVVGAVERVCATHARAHTHTARTHMVQRYQYGQCSD